MSKQAASARGHQPRKRFGQHFLTDAGVIDGIVRAIAPRPGDRMVEIGPGLGALTQPLVERLGHLIVVELDRDLAARMRQRADLSVIESDVLRVDFTALAAAQGGAGAAPSLRVVGNLPYNISTPLLFHLAEYASRVVDMHFMLQKEVVERMVAEPGSAEYGRLSVMLQYRYAMELLFVVPPTAFTPPPKVDSAIVRMIPLPAASLTARDEALFAQVVSAAFGQRRKMLRNTLRDLIGEDALVALDIKPTARAEELGVAEYVRIANALSRP